MGLTLFAGGGYVEDVEVSSKLELKRWDCCPAKVRLNFISWVSNRKTFPSFELLLGYDFVKDGKFKFNLTGGYATTHEVVGMAGIGIGFGVKKKSAKEKNK